eukprot:6451684-Amphidinium_carterae.2
MLRKIQRFKLALHVQHAFSSSSSLAALRLLYQFLLLLLKSSGSKTKTSEGAALSAATCQLP